MTSQANAYFANKLKERELEQVKIPERNIRERTLVDVDIPKVQETHRSNVAQEEQKKRELAETKRYNTLNFYQKGQELGENIRKNNISLISNYSKDFATILSKQKGVLGGLKSGIDSAVFQATIGDFYDRANLDPGHTLQNPNINDLYDETTGKIKTGGK